MHPALILTALCAALYAYVFASLWRRVHAGGGAPRTLLLAVAALLHILLLYFETGAGGAARVSLGGAISMAGWISVVVLLALAFARNSMELGLVILPMALTAVLTGSLLPATGPGLDMSWHILLAIPVYGVLCAAFAQACLLVYQDLRLHNPEPGAAFPALPAIQTMESNLFWLTLVGFILMSVNLVFGMASNLASRGALLAFNHHVLFSVLSWLAFAALLAGRRLMGWRGRGAAKWTIFAFAMLALGYFGARFVNEIILGQ